jgi:MraZ protein
MSGVRVIEFDKVGRIQIPKDLFEYAEIKTTAVLSSSIDRLEIWDKVLYENYLQSHSDEFQKFAEDFLGKSFMNEKEDN